MKNLKRRAKILIDSISNKEELFLGDVVNLLYTKDGGFNTDQIAGATLRWMYCDASRSLNELFSSEVVELRNATVPQTNFHRYAWEGNKCFKNGDIQILFEFLYSITHTTTIK